MSHEGMLIPIVTEINPLIIMIVTKWMRQKEKEIANHLQFDTHKQDQHQTSSHRLKSF